MSQKVLKLFFVTPRSLKLNWNKLAALRKMLKLMATPQFREKPFHRTIIIHIVFNVVNNLRRSFHHRHFLKRNSCPPLNHTSHHDFPASTRSSRFAGVDREEIPFPFSCFQNFLAFMLSSLISKAQLHSLWSQPCLRVLLMTAAPSMVN